MLICPHLPRRAPVHARLGLQGLAAGTALCLDAQRHLLYVAGAQANRNSCLLKLSLHSTRSRQTFALPGTTCSCVAAQPGSLQAGGLVAAACGTGAEILHVRLLYECSCANASFLGYCTALLNASCHLCAVPAVGCTCTWQWC